MISYLDLILFKFDSNLDFFFQLTNGGPTQKGPIVRNQRGGGQFSHNRIKPFGSVSRPEKNNFVWNYKAFDRPILLPPCLRFLLVPPTHNFPVTGAAANGHPPPLDDPLTWVALHRFVPRCLLVLSLLSFPCSNNSVCSVVMVLVFL